MMAAAVVGMVPMMVLFLVFQRAFVRGLTLTGLKE
jgi:ABC-type maltose transport system permease subunit